MDTIDIIGEKNVRIIYKPQLVSVFRILWGISLIMAAFQLIMIYTMIEFSPRPPTLTIEMKVSILVIIVQFIFAIFVGWQYERRRKAFLYGIKFYLIFHLTFSLLLYWLMGAESENGLGENLGHAVFGLLYRSFYNGIGFFDSHSFEYHNNTAGVYSALIVFCFWLPYFSCSKKVKAYFTK